MVQKRYRTPRVRASRAGEAEAPYSTATVRFNLLVPREMKETVDAEAAQRGLSGPELARRLVSEGIDRLRREALWERAARVAPRVADRDRALIRRMDRIAESWERFERTRR